MTADSPRLIDVAALKAIRKRIDEYLADEMSSAGDGLVKFGAEQVNDMSGLELWRQWLERRVPFPPQFGVLLGLEWLKVEPGEVKVATELAPWMQNPFGSIHGGIISTILDTALGASVSTTLPAGVAVPTSDLHVRLLRPVIATSGRLVATAHAVHAGKRHGVAEGVVNEEESGKLVATGSVGLAILRPEE